MSSSYINHFLQPDTVIPDPANPQALNRYSYVGNNPIMRNDPTGHKWDDCEGLSGYRCKIHMKHANKAWEEDVNRQDYLFSLMFRGSGANGAWTVGDWAFYHKHREELWKTPDTWINPDSVKGWDRFSLHAKRLASHYGDTNQDQFVKDFGLVFAGLPTASKSITDAVWSSRGGPSVMALGKGGEEYRSFLGYSNDGLNEIYLDSEDRRENQSHHYAGSFVLSYFFGPHAASFANVGRDANVVKNNNAGDVNLGEVAIAHAFYLGYGVSMRGVADQIAHLK